MVLPFVKGYDICGIAVSEFAESSEKNPAGSKIYTWKNVRFSSYNLRFFMNLTNFFRKSQVCFEKFEVYLENFNFLSQNLEFP